MQKLRESNHPQTATAASADLGIDTPGKFLDPSKVFHPSFDLQVSSEHAAKV